MKAHLFDLCFEAKLCLPNPRMLSIILIEWIGLPLSNQFLAATQSHCVLTTQGWTALHSSCQEKNNFSVASILLDSGANVNAFAMMVGRCNS